VPLELRVQLGEQPGQLPEQLLAVRGEIEGSAGQPTRVQGRDEPLDLACGGFGDGDHGLGGREPW
jgi:hypothetical protein